jgi:cupin 2 domain-containing protein
MDNLFRKIPSELPAEFFETLLENRKLRIERIVSRGHSSPEAGWYDQADNEWVLLLQGSARLTFEDGRQVTMKPGDWLEIPAHQKHRVDWTQPDADTVWLGIHF